MLKRIIPLVAVLSLLVAMFVVPASAATVNGRTIIDYNDYVSKVKVDGENDIVTISLPAYMYGVQAADDNGMRYSEGVDLGSLTFDHNANAGVYFPGSVITNTYLDLKNIPDGSVFTNTGTAWLEVNDLSDGVMEGYYYTAVEYFDDRFQSVGAQSSSRQNFVMTNGADRIDLTWNFTVKAPQGARYCVTIFRFLIYNTIPKTTEHVLWYDFAIPQLQMSINSLYRLQEQTGKTNKLLDQIVNGEVTPETPDGAGSVGDLDDVEGALKDDTAAGRDEADQIFNESSDLVASHMAGFLFLSNVIERFIGVGWLRGVLTVSLSLGILGFLANIAMYAARNGRDAKDAKSGKGG